MTTRVFCLQKKLNHASNVGLPIICRIPKVEHLLIVHNIIVTTTRSQHSISCYCYLRDALSPIK